MDWQVSAERFHTMRLVSTASEFADVVIEFIESTLPNFLIFDTGFIRKKSSSSGHRLYACCFVVRLLPSSNARSHHFPLSLWHCLLESCLFCQFVVRAEPGISWLLRVSPCSLILFTHTTSRGWLEVVWDRPKSGVQWQAELIVSKRHLLWKRMEKDTK